MADVEYIGLAQAIAVLRDELAQAREAGADASVQFTVGPVEVEFATVVKKNAGGKFGVQLGVVTLGADGALANEQTHRVKVTLTPVDQTTGASFKVGDQVDVISDR